MDDQTSHLPGQSDSPPATPADDPREIAARLAGMSAPDGAALLHETAVPAAAAAVALLEPRTAAGILAEMESTAAAVVVAAMEPSVASRVLAEMDSDDRVDILEHIPAELHERLLGQMTAADADDVRRLEQYPPDTAGGIMTSEVTALREDLNVEQAIAELRKLSAQLEQMFYVYVVDRQGRLIGVLSMRDLILARPDTPLSQMMKPNVLSVPATMDQEEVATLFRKYNYLAMPVVDERHRLLGIITVDDVVDVLEAEATEDVQKLFGAGAEERLSSPWQFSFRKRFGWLVVNLATAFMAAAVVGFFQDVIRALAVLAAYMSIVASMGNNAGAQAMSVSIRGIAIGRVDSKLLRHVIIREAMVGVLTGIFIGLITAVVALLFQGNPMLGLVVALALLVIHVLACVSGAVIPFMLKGLGLDPAQSAAILATTVSDVAGFFVLLGLAHLLL